MDYAVGQMQKWPINKPKMKCQKKQPVSSRKVCVCLIAYQSLQIATWSPRSPLDMPFGMSCPITNDSNNSHCGMDFQHGTNDLATYGYDFSDLEPDYINQNFANTFGSQKNLTLVSIKDNGSCSGPKTKMANTLFESTCENYGEISKRKASSGLLNLEFHMVWIGGSSNQIEGSDCIPKNY
ncbi:uncharacterized protein LOC122309015 isoform X1 [Carya illinoinensis]|uniref:uncharacterized protein LOC122309015 isoform X1 n=1 Tax=Carya illinoinensis TaxID=32201 RepID=UPI001C71D6B0|nr:uncharacterized protein LOC122309015 isoform X1 [Carya illinoinensis]XP_042978284.1 uncharacterized protein LOC122309015 isoform X1 [Carya illinoinensis]XP_042978285.1 uncharacterized protein LOC122309015 isoform X1 [Carya illinoinensis]XP_042978286.1 uncharacterized protein LOC122309015 isoform X1 [Carya illinoinensis]XP_042978287.1 uncharacterized protein LOC122309015 isoform X1 [Carya illinoinensis]